MTIFEYACPECDARVISTKRGDRLQQVCVCCAFPGPLRRRFSISIPKQLPEHFNHSVGQVITSNRQFDEALKRKSAEMTEYTGIPHQLERVDSDDPKSLGVTREGLNEAMLAKRGVNLDKFDFADAPMDHAHREKSQYEYAKKWGSGGAGEAPTLDPSMYRVV